jgi:hypothetical protein
MYRKLKFKRNEYHANQVSKVWKVLKENKRRISRCIKLPHIVFREIARNHNF